MDILFGFLISFLLLSYTFLFMYLIKLLPKDEPMITLGIMVFGDLIIYGLYYFVGSELVSNELLFSKGIGIGIILTTFIRVTLFVIRQNNLDKQLTNE